MATTRIEVSPGDAMLLSLEEDAVAVRERLMELGRDLYRATTMAHNAPLARAQFDRMTKPQVADYVLEVTRMRKDDPEAYRAFGICLTVGDRHGDGWRIQYGPAPEDVCSWSDASFIALPLFGAPWWNPSSAT